MAHHSENHRRGTKIIRPAYLATADPRVPSAPLAPAPPTHRLLNFAIPLRSKKIKGLPLVD